MALGSASVTSEAWTFNMNLITLNTRLAFTLYFVTTWLVFASSAHAASYKCQDKNGKWTEEACTGALTPPEVLRKAEEQKELSAELGPKPEPSMWDGSYRAVNQYLQEHAHDPDSVKVDGCTSPMKTNKGWVVRCEYRAKNAFGAVVRGNTYFAIKQNTVVSIEQVN
jgi:hypothetical protein